MILIHGGRDHCRSWDAVALSLRAHFHVIAPDLRGHGDSDWAKGSSYSLSDYVYDVTRLLRSASVHQTAIVGHSMGGMIALMYAGAFPDQVSRLAVLDGVTVVPGSPRKPIHQRITEWVSQLDKIAERTTRSFRSVADAAELLSAHNTRLTSQQALHLATTASDRTSMAAIAGSLTNFRVAERHIGFHRMNMPCFGRAIRCPTLLLRGDESFLPDPEAAGVLSYFTRVRLVTVAGAGHWLHHDKLDKVLELLEPFLTV